MKLTTLQLTEEKFKELKIVSALMGVSAAVVLREGFELYKEKHSSELLNPQKKEIK